MEERKNMIDLFLEMNAQINLSAIRDPEGVYTKHILDSLELTKIINLSDSSTLCDVGTGWGFPLLALAQDAQEKNFSFQLYGLDTRRKKVEAVQQIADACGLKNVHTIWSRAEEHLTQYDIVTARAVAYADKIIPRCVPLCKKGWIVCLYKEVKTEEREEILAQCKKHHLTLEQEHRYRLFDGDIERVIYVLRR